jgi:hypothetical protein
MNVKVLVEFFHVTNYKIQITTNQDGMSVKLDI